MRTSMLGFAVALSLFALSCGAADEGTRADAGLMTDASPATDSAAPDATVIIGTDCLVVSPTTHYFGNLGLGLRSANVSFTVTNRCAGPTGTLSVSVVGSPDFAVTANSCAAPLGAGQSCMVGVQLVPTGSLGARAATLNLTTSPGGAAQAALEGSAVSTSGLGITPNLQNYGSVMVGTQSTPVTLSVFNAGGVVSGSLTTSIAGQHAAEFTLGSNNCGAPLTPAATCTLTISFNPTGSGPRNAIVTVMSMPGGQATATLNGTATP